MDNTNNTNNTNICFVTGCNSYYFKKWCLLYNSIVTYHSNALIYFFDLGLTTDEVNEINEMKKFKIIYHYFNFENYPSWVNIKNIAGQWAWKSQCIKIVLDNNTSIKYIIWCDSLNSIDKNLFGLFQFLDKNNIYTNNTSGTVKTWTYDATIQYFNAENFINYPMKNGALQAYNVTIPWVKQFIYDYANYSLIKECIFPDGSDRSNHRQDQSILTILYYKYKEVYNFDDNNSYMGISIHTDKNFIRPYEK